MHEYRTLKPAHLHQLRVERLHVLEADHQRRVLELEETPGDAAVVEQLMEIERRIKVHLDALEGVSREREETEPRTSEPAPEAEIMIS